MSTMNAPLANDVALVTGASSGIGRATVLALAADGADVVLAARSEEDLKTLSDEAEAEYGVSTLVVPTDIREEEEVTQMVEQTVEVFDGLDIVVSNAGAGAPGTRVDEIPTDEYRWLMETNVDGTFFTTRATMPHLRESRGTIVFVSSIAGQYPRPATPLYASTKWWIRGWALSIEGMVGSDGVGVTVINPAEVRTDILVLDQTQRERFEPEEVTEPEEVAAAIAFAARQSERSTVSELDLYFRSKLSTF